MTMTQRAPSALRMLKRGEPGYEQARLDAVWNARKPGRFPDIIARASSDQDVIEAVTYARAHGLKIAVRGGGHSWCGSPVRDGGILIDLSAMHQISIDPAARTAVVQPAVTAGAFAAALAGHGLAFPVGHCGSVPLSGYLLAGGAGWNRGTWGPACFSVDRVDVVTASGELVAADDRRNSELLWAARGAGPGFFGVATRFYLRVYRMPAVIRTSTYLYPLAEVEEVSRWAAGIAPALPPNLEMLALLASAPPGAPAGPAGKVAGITAAVFTDTEREASAALAVLDSCPSLPRALRRATSVPSSFDALHQAIGTLLPEGCRFAADNLWSDDDMAMLLPRLAEQLVTAPSADSLILATMPPARPAGSRMADAAFSMAGRTFALCYAIWQNQADDAVNERWLRDAVGAVGPLGIGHYVAEADLAAGPSRSIRSFAAPNWQRLQDLKRKHDPADLFHTYLGLE
jgi:FAD/FMN-containing dehydrogenase